MSVNNLSLAINPMAAQATVGKDYLLYVAGIVAPETKETWHIIGGQTGTSIDESTDEIDVTTKTSGGYKASLAGLTSWSLDFDAIALLPGSDNGVEILKRAKAQKTQNKVKILYPDGSYRVGWATSTTYTVDTPYDKDATLKGKLSGYGPLSDQSHLVSIASPTDETFYFSNTSIATSIMLDSVALDAADFTATSKGAVTIKGTYLSTLEAGEYLFYVVLNTGGYSLVAIEVTA
jgi:predicted secreted protein